MTIKIENKQNPWVKLLIELGPIGIFIFMYDAEDPESVYRAVGVFMAAMMVSLIASKILLKEISLMLKISAGLVVVTGGLTIYFHSETFIKMKPTVLYALIAVTLLGGYFRKKAFLKNVLEAGFPPMKQQGWLLMSRNVGLFHIGFAILNELIWRNFTMEQWLWTKVWVFFPLSFVMMAFQFSIIQKHLLPEEDSVSESPEEK